MFKTCRFYKLGKSQTMVEDENEIVDSDQISKNFNQFQSTEHARV